MKNLFLSALLFLSFISIGQQGEGGDPNGYNSFLKFGKEIPVYSFDQPNVEKLRTEDSINDSLKAGPWRFGFNYSTAITFENSASWQTLPNGDQLGILKIKSKQAKTINLSFSNSIIPEGNELYVYNPDKSFILGKFTQNHLFKGKLGTELVPGNTVFVEYYVPAKNKENLGNIEISRVTHGYRTAKEFQTKIFGSSGACNMNVNCPDGAPYINQRNSAIMLVTGGNGFCSAALINNTQFDGTPYVLTANHCYSSDVEDWVFRFNWESPDCDNPSSSPSFNSLSGSMERARRSPSDFLLVEITGGLTNGTVPQSHTPFFAGWDNGDAAPQSTISIHHPSGDIKKISFDDDPATAGQNMGSPEANSTWRVEWDRSTTTEGGSSGSPLFNQDGQIIGQLWGGNAGCNGLNSSGQDYYGRVHNSWEPSGSTNAEQLKHWLDPNNSGESNIAGYDPYNNPLDYNVAVNNITGGEDQLCKKSFIPKVQVFNKGNETITSMVIEYTYNNNNSYTVNWTGSLEKYASTEIELPIIYQADGLNTIEVEILTINGQADEDMSDNEMGISFEAAPNGSSLDFEFYLGCYADEVSWELTDENDETLYSGSGYANGNIANLVEEEFCLSNGCYELILMDDYGDGVEGGIYNNCGYTGSMSLTQQISNELIASLTEEEADFGYEKVFNFCLDNVSLSEEELKNKINIYPNPSSGAFTIELDFEGKKKVVLTNIMGKTMASYELKENTLEIKENELSAGVYMVTISNERKSVTRKVIVE